MKRLTISLATATITLALGGCANLTPPARIHDVSEAKAHWIEYDASRRGALLRTEDGKIRGCAEPAPDIGLSLLSKLKLQPEGVTAPVLDTELSSTVVALAGRTQVVLTLRESLYRICEAYMNGALSGPDVKSLFGDTLKAAQTIAEAVRQEADSEKVKSEAAKTNAETLRSRQTMRMLTQ